MLYLWKPALFQGRKKRSRYFEGWYFKMIDREEKSGLAVIPGISLGDGAENHPGSGGGSRSGSPPGSHAFIQIFTRDGKFFKYLTFPLEAFTYDKRRFSISIGGNRFGETGISLDYTDPDFSVRGEVSFSRFTPWPVSLFSPGAMGWYGLLPTMEDYHGVLSFQHSLSGSLEIDGNTCDLEGGKGYTEKDWGTGFPESWIWAQTNHFNTSNASLHVAVAKIPWKGHFFPGFIVGFRLEGKLYRFCTYNRSKIVSWRREGEGRVNLTLRNGIHRLELEITKMGGTDLKAPKIGSMVSHVNESLGSEVNTVLSENGTLLFRETGRSAGVEIHGDVDALIRPLIAK